MIFQRRRSHLNHCDQTLSHFKILQPLSFYRQLCSHDKTQLQLFGRFRETQLCYKSKDEEDDKKRHFVAFGYFDNPVTLKKNFLTILLKSIKEIFDNPLLEKVRQSSWGPIIGLRLRGLDPIFTCGLRIWQWLSYGLRLQRKTPLASFGVNWQRFTAFKMRMRLPANINQEMF